MDEWCARPAQPGDYAAVVRLLPLLGTDDPIPSEASWREAWLPRTTVLEHEGQVVALGSARILGSWAHVVHVIVDTAHQGRGVGRQVMEALAARARAAGCTHWYLNVKRDNVPALRLYAAVGLGDPVPTAVFRLPRTLLDALPMPEEVPPLRQPSPEEDAALETVHGLIPGSLAAARERGEVALGLGAGEAGFAVFSPAFPGAWCFRARSPALVRPLAAACFERVPDAPAISVVVEDPEVEALLRRSGAPLRMELYRLAGAIP